MSKEGSCLSKKAGEIENTLLSRDIDRLAQLAVSPLGLVSDEVREGKICRHCHDVGHFYRSQKSLIISRSI